MLVAAKQIRMHALISLPMKFTPAAAQMQLACERFIANGYAVLPNFLDHEELKLLRQVQFLKRTCAATLPVHTGKLVAGV